MAAEYEQARVGGTGLFSHTVRGVPLASYLPNHGQQIRATGVPFRSEPIEIARHSAAEKQLLWCGCPGQMEPVYRVHRGVG